MQNFVKSVKQFWRYHHFLIFQMTAGLPYRFLKISVFLVANRDGCTSALPNFIKIRQQVVESLHLTVFKMADIRHIESLKPPNLPISRGLAGYSYNSVSTALPSYHWQCKKAPNRIVAFYADSFPYPEISLPNVF